MAPRYSEPPSQPAMPAASDATPTREATGGAGVSSQWARGDHEHPMATQRAKLTTATDGTVTWTYPIAYGSGVVPIVEGTATYTEGSTNVVNVQLDGQPTNTQAKFRVTRTAQSAVALIGLTILSIPGSIGAVDIHATARVP